ncbi:uncharacterized protein LOC128219614 isoform X2 [Mya arenaria]|uniref:uncharacterized protein LOC128219614 isoform X2 n=1 Tax=Mya arenaria TaxID=6604 RepID=UPI0022E2698B|nr:uncharacterized protein LOC128219614 isoform X2 [Mya arenaria]
MMRMLLLPLCLMHLKVAGTITLTTDNSLVEIDDKVAMTCIDTEEVAIEIYFAGQAIGNCNLFGGTICAVSNETLYSVSFDESPIGYNLLTFTINSFAASNCGEYTCLKKSDARVRDTTTVGHKLSYGDSCGTCGQCSPSTSMSCSGHSTCMCNYGYKYKDNGCDIDQSVEAVLGKTATINCKITGEFSSPRWDDGSTTKVYMDEGQTTFNTTNSRRSRSKDTKNLIITSIEDSDAGTYRCSITTPTTKDYTATLNVTKPTAIGKGVKVVLGKTAIINCNITGEFSNPRWDYGSTTMAEGQTTINTINSRWSRSKDTKNLIITLTEESDAGIYMCSITTPTTKRYTTNLAVNKPPVTNVTNGKDPVSAVLILVFQTFVIILLLVFAWKEVKEIKGIILFGLGVLDLILVSAASGYHIYMNTGDRDGDRQPWYVMTTFVLNAVLFIVLQCYVRVSNRRSTSLPCLKFMSNKGPDKTTKSKKTKKKKDQTMDDIV